MILQKIPKVIFQISLLPKPNPQPKYVLDMLLEKCSGWNYLHFNDKKALEYLKDNPCEEFPLIVNKFIEFKGAHKSDLFRYYFIYKQGGVYLDNDAMIHAPLDSIVKDYDFFSVNSNVHKKSIFQGFLGAAPKNQIVHEALKDAYNTDLKKFIGNYHLLCKNLYNIIKKSDLSEVKYILYEEEIGHMGISPTKNTSGEIILLHHWKNKIIPPHHESNDILLFFSKPKYKILLLANKLLRIANKLLRIANKLFHLAKKPES